jgi:hypothetical protein
MIRVVARLAGNAEKRYEQHELENSRKVSLVNL